MTEDVWKLAGEIAHDLFTNGSKQVAQRLVLESKDQADLGGLSIEVVRDRIAKRIEVFVERRKNK